MDATEYHRIWRRNKLKDPVSGPEYRELTRVYKLMLRSKRKGIILTVDEALAEHRRRDALRSERKAARATQESTREERRAARQERDKEQQRKRQERQQAKEAKQAKRQERERKQRTGPKSRTEQETATPAEPQRKKHRSGYTADDVWDAIERGEWLDAQLPHYPKWRQFEKMGPLPWSTRDRILEREQESSDDSPSE